MFDDVLVVEIADTGPESLCKRARELIRTGFSPSRLVEWQRNGEPVWQRPAQLSVWAAYTVEEGTYGSPRFRKWKPYPGSE